MFDYQRFFFYPFLKHGTSHASEKDDTIVAKGPGLFLVIFPFGGNLQTFSGTISWYFNLGLFCCFFFTPSVGLVGLKSTIFRGFTMGFASHSWVKPECGVYTMIKGWDLNHLRMVLLSSTGLFITILGKSSN